MHTFTRRQSTLSRCAATPVAAALELGRALVRRMSYATTGHPALNSRFDHHSYSRFRLELAGEAVSVSQSLARFCGYRSPRSLYVLVAGDNSASQFPISAILKRLGHRADVVENGLLAVEACRRRIYDVVLVDIQMREMDGLAATRAIRSAGDAYDTIEIVALTVDALPERYRFLDGVGFTRFIAKPIDQDRLATLLASISVSPTSAARQRVEADRAF